MSRFSLFGRYFSTSAALPSQGWSEEESKCGHCGAFPALPFNPPPPGVPSHSLEFLMLVTRWGSTWSVRQLPSQRRVVLGGRLHARGLENVSPFSSSFQLLYFFAGNDVLTLPNPSLARNPSCRIADHVVSASGRVTISTLADLARGLGGGAFDVVATQGQAGKRKRLASERSKLDLGEVGGKVTMSKEVRRARSSFPLAFGNARQQT